MLKGKRENIKGIGHKKIVIISSVLPATNYSAYLIGALQKMPDSIDVMVYTGREKANLKVSLKNVQLVWNKNIFYPFQILMQALKDKPGVLHIQHEINMFGGPATAIIFPILPVLLKLFRFKVIVTVHAVVARKDISKEFLKTFFKSGKEVPAFLIKNFFSILYKTTSFFADKIFVHADILKHILISDYKIREDKIIVIHHGVPDKIEVDKNFYPVCDWGRLIADNEFILYYGYFHRRKGIDIIIQSFKKVLKDFPGLKMVMAGGTLQEDCSQQLKKLVLKLNMEENIIFTGFIEEIYLSWLMSNCKFILLPAQYSISASGPLAQTIAYRKPVIVSNVGVFKEEIANCIDGLVADNSIEDWARQIELLIRDNRIYEKISHNLEEKYNKRKWSKIAETTNSIYQKL